MKYTSWCLFYTLFFFETGSHYEARAGLELHPFLPSMCWDDKHALAATATSYLEVAFSTLVSKT